jgi:uncharacterized protein
MLEIHPPLPPFTREAALIKVRAAEDAWNSRDPHRVCLVYTEDSRWRDRGDFITGRDAIIDFLTDKWKHEAEYALRKSMWSFGDDRIAVRFQYEWRDAANQWYRSYGNALWTFTTEGLMRRREASVNDIKINDTDRRYFGPRDPRDEIRQEIPLQ